MHKEQSDVDVALSDGADDGAYLRAMGEHWPRLLDEVKPDVVFYQCGVDILESDKLGRPEVSRCKLPKRRGSLYRRQLPSLRTISTWSWNRGGVDAGMIRKEPDIPRCTISVWRSRSINRYFARRRVPRIRCPAARVGSASSMGQRSLGLRTTTRSMHRSTA